MRSFKAGVNEIRPDVLMHTTFVNTYAITLGDELFLVDPGLARLAPTVHNAVREWTDNPLTAALYTHGHFDHAFGLPPWLDAGEKPEIIAQERCVDRFNRYRLTAGFNARINQRQFSLPKPQFPERFDYPHHARPRRTRTRNRWLAGAVPRRHGRDRRRRLCLAA